MGVILLDEGMPCGFGIDAHHLSDEADGDDFGIAGDGFGDIFSAAYFIGGIFFVQIVHNRKNYCEQVFHIFVFGDIIFLKFQHLDDFLLFCLVNLQIITSLLKFLLFFLFFTGTMG